MRVEKVFHINILKVWVDRVIKEKEKILECLEELCFVQESDSLDIHLESNFLLVRQKRLGDLN